MGGKKVGSFSSPFLPSSASYRFFFSSVRWSCASYRCSYFCFRMKQGISSTVWPVGCLHLSKKTTSTKHKQTNKQTQNPKHNTAPPKSLSPNPHPSSSFSFSVVFVSPSCIHKKAAKDRKLEAAWAHWLLGQLDLSSLARPILQATFCLFLITNIHMTTW